MNWEMISAVGQMLGAVGVIISIVYLAAQIRSQNKESRRAAMNVLTTHWSDLNRSLVDDRDFAALWIRALQSFDELDATSKLRFGAHLGAFFAICRQSLSCRPRWNAGQAIMAWL
jgi:heme/copper-type cytochrome/quinol oxidase subunit 1